MTTIPVTLLETPLSSPASVEWNLSAWPDLEQWMHKKRRMEQDQNTGLSDQDDLNTKQSVLFNLDKELSSLSFSTLDGLLASMDKAFSQQRSIALGTQFSVILDEVEQTLNDFKKIAHLLISEGSFQVLLQHLEQWQQEEHAMPLHMIYLGLLEVVLMPLEDHQSTRLAAPDLDLLAGGDFGGKPSGSSNDRSNRQFIHTAYLKQQEAAEGSASQKGVLSVSPEEQLLEQHQIALLQQWGQWQEKMTQKNITRPLLWHLAQPLKLLGITAKHRYSSKIGDPHLLLWKQWCERSIRDEPFCQSWTHLLNQWASVKDSNIDDSFLSLMSLSWVSGEGPAVKKEHALWNSLSSSWWLQLKIQLQKKFKKNEWSSAIFEHLLDQSKNDLNLQKQLAYRTWICLDEEEVHLFEARYPNVSALEIQNQLKNKPTYNDLEFFHINLLLKENRWAYDIVKHLMPLDINEMTGDMEDRLKKVHYGFETLMAGWERNALIKAAPPHRSPQDAKDRISDHGNSQGGQSENSNGQAIKIRRKGL